MIVVKAGSSRRDCSHADEGPLLTLSSILRRTSSVAMHRSQHIALMSNIDKMMAWWREGR
jgi:hypothetical protein